METLFSDSITPKKFTKFIIPSILMMVVTSIYYGMDSVFVANFVGSEALASLSIAYPLQGIMWGAAMMLAAGSSAIIAIKMGEGKQDEANEKYTLICIVGIIVGVLFMAVSLIFMKQIVNFLGATDQLEQYCNDYLRIFVWSFPAAFLGTIFEYFIRVDGSPGYTLILYVAGGIVHLGSDILLMGVKHMGIAGAAYAHLFGIIVIMLVGLAYFIFLNKSLRFRRFKNDWGYIGHSFVNGSSEMVSEGSVGITTFFFNMVILGLTGETGVAAMSIVMNLSFVFISLFLGYVCGVGPLISYFFGSKEYGKVNTFIRYSRDFIIVASIICAAICFFLGKYIVMIYERPGSELYDMAVMGTRLMSISMLIAGINVFASGFFTAYGNGLISAIISLSRGLIMLIIGVYLLGWLFGMTGVYLALTFSEAITLFVTFYMFKRYKNVYHYDLGIGKI